MKKLHKDIQLLIGNRLAEYGFTKKGRYVFVRTVNDVAIQDVGFTVHGHNHVCYLGPSISIQYPKVKMLLKELCDDYFSVVILNIGYLMPEDNYKEWRFTLDQNISSVVDSMVEATIQYGIPFMNELSDERNLIKALENSSYRITLGPKSYLLPVMYYLCGEKECALQSLDKCIEEYRVSFMKHIERYMLSEDTVNKNFQAYMAFVENFKRFIASS